LIKGLGPVVTPWLKGIDLLKLIDHLT